MAEFPEANRAGKQEVATAYLWLRLAVAVLVALPLAANHLANLMGWRVFYLADPTMQLVWGTLVQLAAGRPAYSWTWQNVRSRAVGWRSIVSGVLSLASAGTYGYSVVATFAKSPVGSPSLFYDVSAALLLLALLLQCIKGTRAS